MASSLIGSEASLLDKPSTICDAGRSLTVPPPGLMENDVELLRDLLFVLEVRQMSPRMMIRLDIAELARELDSTPRSIVLCLDQLAGLLYIEGTGRQEPGFWYFRKLTRKGVQFVRIMRKPENWERLKQRFASSPQG